MPARQGKRETITDEDRLVLYEAFRGQKLTEQEIAERVAKLMPGTEPPSATTIRRIIDPGDPAKVKSSSILWAVREVLGVRETTEYRVVFRREEIALIDAWRAIRAARREAADAILADLESRGERAARILAEQRELDQGLTLPAPDDPKPHPDHRK